jgi:transposase-like protein
MAGTRMVKRKRNRYSPEFKAEAVELMQRSDRPVIEIATELGVSEQSLYRWAQQSKVDVQADPDGPLTTAERTELAALRRRVKEVEMERDFLKKTAAYFAGAKK